MENNENNGNKNEKPSMLLHSCCGPCSTAVIERLIDRYDLTVYFYNPNITNEGEYDKRLDTEKKFINEYNKYLREKNGDDSGMAVKLIEGEYDPENYLMAVKGLEEEPENGKQLKRLKNSDLKILPQRFLSARIKIQIK